MSGHRSNIAGATIGVLLILLGIVLGSGTPTIATAQTATLTVTPNVVDAGRQISITGSGLGRTVRGSLLFDGRTITTFKTARDGSVSIRWTIPTTTSPGRHLLVVATSVATVQRQVDVLVPGKIALGAYLDSAPGDPAVLDSYAAMTGGMPEIVMWYQHWGSSWTSALNTSMMETVIARGSTPLITWEPWDPSLGVNQPSYALSEISAGSHDDYIRSWARDIAAWAGPLYLRFAHEMNGTWYPWAAGVNGNSANDYVDAWQHVVDIFRSEGATNVRWVWSPNVDYDGSWPLAQLYPGDAYVDWIGMDGYNWGTSQEWSVWQSMESVFATTYNTLSAMAPNKPLMIAETASAEAGGDKATWITTGYLSTMRARFPKVRAVIWFEQNKETDWHVASSASALTAYQQVVVSPTYTGVLP